MSVPPERRTTAGGDLVLRAGPEHRIRAGAHIPLLVDLERLYVFDRAGTRICPAPDSMPGLQP